MYYCRIQFFRFFLRFLQSLQFLRPKDGGLCSLSFFLRSKDRLFRDFGYIRGVKLSNSMGKKDNQNEEKQVKTWICSVCGYEHVGTEPPKNCPICGVEGIYFDAVE